MARIAILIDGSNFVASLYRADLGYPALTPLVELLRGSHVLSYARFYGAPPPREPWAGRWKAFVSANRHVPGLDFFQGYRHARTGDEKGIDVALAVDLLYGKLANHFDRAAVISGDGDLVYAFKVAKTVLGLRVYLLETGAKGLARARIPYTVVRPEELVGYGICDRSAGAPVPARHAAPPGSPVLAPLLRGSSATPAG
jgi:hypothetical protein